MRFLERGTNYMHGDLAKHTLSALSETLPVMVMEPVRTAHDAKKTLEGTSAALAMVMSRAHCKERSCIWSRTVSVAVEPAFFMVA
jgi:hypothetical protein